MKADLQIGQLIQINVEKLTVGGDGLGRHLGFVVFVPFSVPGDLLEVQITEIKKNFAKADIKKIITPSADRTNPPCQYFGSCGGCNWQNIKYETQVQQKWGLVQDSLKNFFSEESKKQGIQASPQTSHYRNRITLKAIDNRLGYFARESHDLIEIESCWIADQKINLALTGLRNKVQGSRLRHLQLALTDRDDVRIQEVAEAGALDFSQVNEPINQIVKTDLLSLLSGRQFGRVWDLYAGSGNFSFLFLDHRIGSEVWAVESHSASVEKAQDLIKTRSLSSKVVRFFCSDVGLFLKRQSPAEKDLVMIDPPRAGAGPEVITALSKSPIRNLIYLSCHLATLARDLSTLKTQDPSWKIQWIKAYDMFPQTDHVETLVMLQR